MANEHMERDSSGQASLGVIDTGTEEMMKVGGDLTSRAVKVALMLYNTDTLAWEAASKKLFDVTVNADDIYLSVDDVETKLDTLISQTDTVDILEQLQGKGYGFAGFYDAGQYLYVAEEDGSGNYIITRYNTLTLGTNTNDDTVYATGSGGLPSKATWSGLSYADRQAAF